MIPPSTAAVAVSIAKGVIKLGGRIDRLMAEKSATTGDLILPMPPVAAGMTVIEKAQELGNYLEKTKSAIPDPLGNSRNDIVKLLYDRKTVDDPYDAKIISDRITHYFETHLPEKAISRIISPDSEYLKKLKQFYPTINLDDQETRMAASYIRAGRDDRIIGYAGRLALLVVDVLSEFGAENTSLFIRDKKTQDVIEAVLYRFSEPDLENYYEWSPLLRHAIGSTLNGVLDVHDSLGEDKRWLEVVLDALDSARSEGGDDYLVGLFNGKGYRLLISKTLSGLSDQIGNESTNAFEKIAADILKSATPLVKANDKNFGDFFNDHWGDLLSAGLLSLEKHGPQILDGEKPVLKETLLAVINQLARTDTKELISSETLISLVDSAIGAVALSPELLTSGEKEEWFKALIESVLKTTSELKIENTFSKGGLERIIQSAASAFADHPELLVKNNNAFQAVVGGILGKIGGVDTFTAESISTAAIRGTLDGITENPALLNTKYAEIIAGFAGKVSELASSKSITGIQAGDLINAATDAVLENPILFNTLGDKLTHLIVDTVTEASAGKDEIIISKPVQIAIMKKLLSELAIFGNTLSHDQDMDKLKTKLFKVVSLSFEKASVSIGSGMGLSTLPEIIGLLVGALAKGELINIDIEDETFKRLFNQYMQEVNARAAA